MPPSPSTASSDAFSWRALVRRSGPDGAAWVDQYETHRELITLSSTALGLLHRRRFAEGREELHRLEAGLEALRAAHSIRCVVERYLFGVLGYYHYRKESWTEAERFMEKAHASVAAAVEAAPFLVPLADACHEFRLHRARIARNQRRWPDMFRRIDEVRAMMAGDAPLCVLTDGREVGYGDVAAFYRSLDHLTPAEQEEIEPMLTAEGRLELLDAFVRRMFVLPGFAIQYP